MDIESIYNELIKNIDKDKIFLNEPMKKHTSFKIGGNADVYLKLNNVDDIRYVLKLTEQNNIPLSIVGNGSNLLVKDNGIRGIVLKPTIEDIEIEEQNEDVIITVGAGVPIPKLSLEMAKLGYSGLEFACRNTWNHWRCSKNECGCVF